MSANELSADGDWSAVHVTVRSRLAVLGITLSALSRASGISESSIRYLKLPGKRQRSTLVALSAALGLRYTYLEDVLRGQADDDGELPLPHEVKARLDRIEAAIGGIGDTLTRMETALARLASPPSDDDSPRN